MSYANALPPQSIAAHDLAREVPEELWTEVVDGLVAHVGATPSRTCLDVGTGSGAVGGRLAARGVEVVGVDCNESMLGALRASYPQVPVVRGDAEALPVRDGWANLVTMACVLHLVRDWRGALREAVRVATREGRAVLAVNVGASALARRTGISSTFVDALTARVDVPPMPGPASSSELADELVAQGCTPLPAAVAHGHALRSVRDHIFRLEWNPFGWPPGVPQWALSEAAEETRQWAQNTFGSLDEPAQTPVSVGFALFRCPAEST